MNKQDVETYAQLLNDAANMLDQLNKRKNNPDVTEIATQLREVAKTLLDTNQTEVQKSTNLLIRLFNYIKAKLGA